MVYFVTIACVLNFILISDLLSEKCGVLGEMSMVIWLRHKFSSNSSNCKCKHFASISSFSACGSCTCILWKASKFQVWFSIYIFLHFFYLLLDYVLFSPSLEGGGGHFPFFRPHHKVNKNCIWPTGGKCYIRAPFTFQNILFNTLIVCLVCMR